MCRRRARGPRKILRPPIIVQFHAAVREEDFECSVFFSTRVKCRLIQCHSRCFMSYHIRTWYVELFVLLLYHVYPIGTPTLRGNDRVSVRCPGSAEDIHIKCNIGIIRAHAYQGKSYHYCLGYSVHNESVRLSQLKNPSRSSGPPVVLVHVVWYLFHVALQQSSHSRPYVIVDTEPLLAFQPYSEPDLPGALLGRHRLGLISLM